MLNNYFVQIMKLIWKLWNWDDMWLNGVVRFDKSHTYEKFDNLSVDK